MPDFDYHHDFSSSRAMDHGGDSEKGHILLVEDDPFFRDIMKNFLAEQGYEASAVGNGNDGVREVETRDFDAVVCDIQMPGMAGPIFFRTVEKIRPHLAERFIFMTGYRTDASLREFIHTVNGMLLSKPFHLDELRETLSFIEVRRNLRVA
jgi:CheY-like chemotaxis protein